MKELIKRLGLETPDFFKRIRNRALVLLGAMVGVYAAHTSGAYTLPDWSLFGVKLTSVVKGLAEAGVLIAVMAQMTAKPTVPNEKLNEKI